MGRTVQPIFLLNDIPQDVIDIYHSVEFINDKEKTFVQANDMRKVIRLAKFATKSRTMEEIRQLFGFTMRQAYMYTAAAAYLDLVLYKKDKEGNRRVFATNIGRKLARLSNDENTYNRAVGLLLFEQMMKHEYMHRIFEDVLLHQSLPGRVRIFEIVRELDAFQPRYKRQEKPSDVTLKRRVETVRKWFIFVLTSVCLS